MSILREKLKDLPKSPGIYQFLDSEGQVLYVGKAKNISNRLKQYFLKELGRGPAIEQMVMLANDIKWIETESEIEAVLLEAKLIKNLKPKYNIRFKDDKSFLVIKITKEQFSKVELVRFKNVDLTDKKAEYFGPYPSGDLLKRSLRYLRKIFPFKDCSVTKFNTYKKKGRACIFGDIKICTVPCTLSISEKEYRKNINYLKAFLRGRKSEIIKKLEQEMAAYSKAQNYEAASLIRDKLQALGHLKEVALGIRDDAFSSSTVIFNRIECYDISNIGGEFAVGSMVVFTGGKADKDEYRHFRIKYNPSRLGSQTSASKAWTSRSEADVSGIMKRTNHDTKYKIHNTGMGDTQMLKEVLERRFKNDWPLPDLIIIDGGEQQLAVARQVLKSYNISVSVISISKGPKRKKNDFHFSDLKIGEYFKNRQELQKIAIQARDEAHRFAISYYRKLHRKAMIEK